MDYYNSMLPQNQPPMMQSMHYSQMAQPEIGQDLWDHEKHVRAHVFLKKKMKFLFEIKIDNLMFRLLLCCYCRIKDGRNGLTSQLAS